MKYQVLEILKVKTPQGVMALEPGQLINLHPEKAITQVEKGKIKPLKEAMLKDYKCFIRWLSQHDLTANKIKEKQPKLLQDIHEAIELMDSCFSNEKLQGFKDSMEKVKRLYLEAVQCQ